MNNIINYSIIYYYKKFNYKIIAIIALALILFNIYAVYQMNNSVFSLNDYCNIQKNGWDLYSYLYIDGSIAVNGLIFLSLYAIFNCFQNDKKEYFIKIRSSSSFRWFITKIISIFLFNLIIIIVATLITLIIGSITFGSSLKWSSFGDMEAFSRFYSPINLALFNILTYSFFVTFLAEIVGVLIIKLKNKIIVGSLVVIYLVTDTRIFSFSEKIIKLLRYFSLYAYTSFGSRIYYSYDKQLNYFTMRESLEFSGMLFVLMIILIKIIDGIKKVKKYNEI